MKRLLILIFSLFFICTALAESTPTDLMPTEPQVEDILPELIPPTVEIWGDYKSVIMEGETITLYSKVEHTEGWIIQYQWQSGTNDIFNDISGATNSTYSFIANTQTLALDYRLVVHYKYDK